MSWIKCSVCGRMIFGTYDVKNKKMCKDCRKILNKIWIKKTKEKKKNGIQKKEEQANIPKKSY